MADVQLISYKIRKLDMYNTLQHGQRVEIKNKFGFEVAFSIRDRMAVATLTEHLKLENNPNDFGIGLMLEGIFNITGVENDESKREIHVKCYDELFPYANQIISQLAMNSGMDGLMLKKNPIKPESINFGQRSEKGKSDKILDFPV